MGLEGAVTHFAQKFTNPCGILQHIVNEAQSVFAVNRVIFVRKLFLDIDDRVNAEPAKALVQPPVDVFVNLFPDGFVFPVQVRLFFVEHVHVLLVRASGKGFPHRAAEVASPVAGQFAFFSVLYVEEVAVFPVRSAQAFWNHSCSSEQWFTTRSMRMYIPRFSASFSRWSISSMVPKEGSIL